MKSGSEVRKIPQGSRCHVVASGSGWAVKPEGGESSARIYGSKAEAIRVANELVGQGGGELLIHAPGGRVRESFTVGREPFGRISEIEGIFATDDARSRAEQYDRSGLSSRERRESIIEAYRRKG